MRKNNIKNDNNKMGKKVFISHATVDEQIVSLFVDKILCNGSGVKIEDVIYTSREDSGIVNGDEIPSSIKNGIKESKLFFMMVSEGYKNSEVCLNEMGAAWMRDDLVKKIILLPNVNFNEIGWLMSLNKGTKMTDSSGLDAIHDQVMDLLSTSLRTATWNRYKDEFLHKIQDIMHGITTMVSDSHVSDDDDDELDLLEIREKFNDNNQESIAIIHTLTDEIGDYANRIRTSTNKLNKVASNPTLYNTSQIRGMLYKCAKDMDYLSDIYEVKAPQLKERFDASIRYACMMNEFTDSDSIKEDNRNATRELIDQMIGVKDEITQFKKTISELSDIDKTLKKAKNRLVSANQMLLDVLAFCITRATEYMMS